MSESVAIYSALYGRYDTPKPLPDLGVPAFLFTDEQGLEVRGWTTRYVDHGIATLNGDPVTTAPMLAHKWWKLHPGLALPNVDVSIWVDASMEVESDVFAAQCVAALGTDDWALMKHPERICIYPEADLSATLTWRYDADAIRRQAAHYRAFHPPNWGLFATGNLIRRHTPEVIALNDAWWDECVNWSHQDQLSLPVLLRLWENKIKWNTNVPWHTWWRLHPHGT